MAGFMILPTPIIIPHPPHMILKPPLPSCGHLPQLDLYYIPFYKDILQVTVAKKAAHVYHWISTVHRLHRHSPNKKIIIGLNKEWRPNTAAGDDHPIVVLQLSIGRHSLVFQLLHADLLPPSLHHFLVDPRHVFCGIGIEENVRKLYDHHGLYAGSTADLNKLLKMVVEDDDMGDYRYMGLKKMSVKVLGKEMKKLFNVTMSRWDNEDLDVDQIELCRN